ncbi:FIST signal transduction protein [Christiangramia portivictoriae]|uniref:FIST signal transduction protein n=1 Tax=Christiangramia portivictoriae TaxID=326069 RepID=UPI00040E3BA6|nr:FIST C-terminal domain-containing protein [Christiangramia portivictoriae]
MKVVQAKYEAGVWKFRKEPSELVNPIVLIFGDRHLLEESAFIEDCKIQFPYNNLVFGTAAGEILGDRISENEAVATFIDLKKSHFNIKTANIHEFNMDGVALGKHLISSLDQNNLRHVFVISEGSFINGSDLLRGLEHEESKQFCVTGGMCGDGPRFEKTLAGLNAAKEGEVVAIGFYGDNLEVSFASVGGWIPFGPERLITRSEKNILFELDGQPALDLYSKYLGEKSAELPQSSLFYPLYVREEGKKHPVVRTILNINRENNSMILAGDVPQGSRVQLMMASADALLNGAQEAAALANQDRKKSPELAILVSCIGRKLVLSQRAEEEIEEVINVIGKDVTVGGFYSYGEIAPFYGESLGSLHNQTMTLTLLSE